MLNKVSYMWPRKTVGLIANGIKEICICMLFQIERVVYEPKHSNKCTKMKCNVGTVIKEE